MTIAAPTFSQIKAQVAAIRQKVPQARAIGIRAEGRWTGERFKQDGHETFRIEQCDSPLHMRTVLQEEAGEAMTVLITSLDERKLGDDILVRLARRRVLAAMASFPWNASWTRLWRLWPPRRPCW